MRLRRPTLVVNVLLGVLALGGAGWAYTTVAVSNTSSTRADQRLFPVTTGTVTQTVSATGSVASADTANASFITAGTVTGIDVKVGDTVKAGQVLAKVDPTNAQAQLNTAEANLTAAQDNLAQIQGTGGATAATIATAQAQVTSAEATVTADRQAVSGTVLTAPMAGTVIAVNGTVGNPSGAGAVSVGGSGSSGNSGGSGTASRNGGGSGTGSSSTSSSSTSSSSSSSSGFVQIADLSHLQVTAYFAEADATRLTTGQAAAITWDALANGTATGKVASISPTATTVSGVNSYQVTIGLDSVPAGTRIGQTVTAVVTVARVDNAVRVPAAAVTTAGGFSFVQLVGANGTTQRVRVTLGITGNSFDQVTSGLTAGQEVAVTIQTSGTGTSGTGRLFGGGGLGGVGGTRNFGGTGTGGSNRTGGGN